MQGQLWPWGGRVTPSQTTAHTHGMLGPGEGAQTAAAHGQDAGSSPVVVGKGRQPLGGRPVGQVGKAESPTPEGAQALVGVPMCIPGAGKQRGPVLQTQTWERPHHPGEPRNLEMEAWEPPSPQVSWPWEATARATGSHLQGRKGHLIDAPESDLSTLQVTEGHGLGWGIHAPYAPGVSWAIPTPATECDPKCVWGGVGAPNTSWEGPRPCRGHMQCIRPVGWLWS